MRRPTLKHARITTKTPPALAAILITAILGSFTGTAHAQTWTGGSSDLWGDMGNWTGSTVPNSSTAIVTIATTTNNPVLINISPTIDSLTIGATSSVILDPNQSFTFAGASGSTFTNAGSFQMDAAAATTRF